MTDIPLSSPPVVVLCPEAHELGEGARLVDGRLLFVDLLSGRLRSHPGTPGSPVSDVLALDVPLGAVAPVAGTDGDLVAAAGDGVALLGADGSVRWLAHPEAAADGATRMNDGVADGYGRFWASSMAYDGETPLGALYRVEPDGTVLKVLDSLTIGNGPAVSADGRHLFLADSPRRTVTRYSLGADGSLTAGTVVVRVEGDGVPDGMTTDVEGTLWVAVHGAGEVHRYSGDGELLLRVALPARQPTSVALLPGALVVTTATEGMGVPGDSDGRLLRVELADLDVEATPVPVRTFGPLTDV